jgi:hypothetical protein
VHLKWNKKRRYGCRIHFGESSDGATEPLEASFFSCPAVAHKDVERFWKWFLEADDIPKQDFLEELERDDNPTNAFERVSQK